MADQPVLTPRYAVVDPYAAFWILKRLRPADRRQGVLMARGAGARGLADQLERSFRQLQASAEWHAHAASPAALPLAEVTEALAAEGGPELDVNEQITTTEAARMLKVSPRRITQLILDERLSGRRPGRAWLVDRGSVQDLLEARRTA
jgi:excisionase family DNA binding protein